MRALSYLLTFAVGGHAFSKFMWWGLRQKLSPETMERIRADLDRPATDAPRLVGEKPPEVIRFTRGSGDG